MLKRIINILLLLVSLSFILLFQNTYYGDFKYVICDSILIFSLFLVTSLLFVNRKGKGHVYDIITLLLMIISGVVFILLIVNCVHDFISYLDLFIIVIIIYGLVIMNIIDFKKDLPNSNLLLTILVSLITIFVFIRIKNNCNYNETITNSNYMVVSYICIFTLYLSLLMHYFVNRKKTL